jgi:hypothetical protein
VDESTVGFLNGITAIPADWKGVIEVAYAAFAAEVDVCADGAGEVGEPLGPAGSGGQRGALNYLAGPIGRLSSWSAANWSGPPPIAPRVRHGLANL